MAASRAYFGIVVGLMVAHPALGLTPGRSWMPQQQLDVPGYAYLAAPRLESQSGMGLTLWTGAVAAVDDGVGFVWADSTWTPRWWLGATPDFFLPVNSPPGNSYLVWIGGADVNAGNFYLSQVLPGAVSAPDLVTTVTPYYANKYAAAVSQHSRWAAIADYLGASVTTLRAFSSDTLGIWREARYRGPCTDYGTASDGVAVDVEDDSTGLVAWSGCGVGLGLIRHGVWQDLALPFAPGAAIEPRLRPRPSGGHWLAWGSEQPFLLVRPVIGNALGPIDTIRCVYHTGAESQFLSAVADLSMDPGEYPAIAWSAGIGFRDVLCVSTPTDSGFTTAEEMVGMPGGIVTVARDPNGDVWVASWDYEHTSVHWTHTYTSATVSGLSLAGDSSAPLLRWGLSTPAPETYWGVLRAINGGPFVEVARIRAGTATAMSWTDPAPPPSLARYKVRRECLDTRYQLDSPETSFATPVLASLVSATAAIGRVELLWSVNTQAAVAVYRSSDSLTWVLLSRSAPDGRGLVSIVDSSVEARRRYGYRLGIPISGGETPAGETWIEVPAVAEFGLRRVFPNPTDRAFAISFSLPSAAPARLELFDLSGRRVALQEVGSLGPGIHTLALESQQGQLPAGVYAVRLTQGKREASAKISVLR